MEAGISEGGGGADLVTLMGQNAELEQTGDPAAGKSQATGSPGRAGLVRHPSLPGGRGSTDVFEDSQSCVGRIFRKNGVRGSRSTPVRSAPCLVAE